jgi:phosphoglycolate phosphatase
MDPVSGEIRATACSLPPMPGNRRAHGCTWQPFEPEGLMQLLDKTFVEGAESPWPICDLKALMQSLAGSGMAIGIASSDGEASIRRTLEVLGLTSEVGFIAGYDSGHGPKPEPGMLLAFALHLGLHPSQIVMVGDNGMTWRWRGLPRRALPSGCSREPARARPSRGWRTF